MKKIYAFLVGLITFLSFNITVYAAGATVSASSYNVNKGASFTVSANIQQVAAWNLNISASGPVSGCQENFADATTNAQDTTKSVGSVACQTTGTGTIYITLSGDVTPASTGEPQNVSQTITVNVVEPPPAPSPSPVVNTNNNDNNNNNNNQQTEEDTRSSNTNLKDITISGKIPDKQDDNTYTMTLGSGESSITISATPEDEKSTIAGLGDHNLQIGENSFELVVTAENGTQKTYVIKIVRKDSYSLEDLDEVLKKSPSEDKDITIEPETILTEAILNKVKSSNAIVNFNYYDNDKKLIYSWKVNGTTISNIKDFQTKVKFASDYQDIIDKESNYASGVSIHLNHNGDIPKNLKLKVYVGDKFQGGDVVNVYAYENGKLKEVQLKLTVNGGFVEFQTDKSIEYFITKSELGNVKSSSSINIFLITTIIGVIIIILLVLVLLFKGKKKEKKEDVIVPIETQQNTQPQEVISNQSADMFNEPPTVQTYPQNDITSIGMANTTTISSPNSGQGMTPMPTNEMNNQTSAVPPQTLPQNESEIPTVRDDPTTELHVEDHVKDEPISLQQQIIQETAKAKETKTKINSLDAYLLRDKK